MSTSTQGIPFRTNASQALRNATLRGAMRNATDTFTIKRADALSGVPVEEWREQASAMRFHVLDNLSDYVDRFEKNAARACARVHRAKDSQEARDRMVGGHAYGTTYPGPMGIVLTTLLDGIERAHPLLEATTLCGACGDVCPVKVPLPQLLRKLRERRVKEGLTPKLEQTGMAGFGKIVKSPFLFHLGQTAAHLLWPVATKIGPKVALDRLPRPVGKPFGRRVS